MTIKLERYFCAYIFLFCTLSYSLLFINIVNSLKLVAGFSFISFLLRLACNSAHNFVSI